MRLCGRWSKGVILFALGTVWMVGTARALDRTWIGGNVDWVDAGTITNWNPNDEPDADDRAIFNTANSVNLGSNNSVNGLSLAGGIDLFTNDSDLTVDGLVEVGGASTFLVIDEGLGSVNADDVTINASGVVELRGGLLTLDEEAGTSLLDINAGGTIQGNGVISFADVPGVATTVLVNDGELTALARGLTIFSPPPVGTLQINTAGPNSRVDLDGAGEAGVVNVNRNQTLDLNIGFADAFNGTLNLAHEATFDSLNAWTLAGGSIVVNNGLVDNPIPTPDVLAGTAYIKGGLLTQSGGVINVVDTDGTLQLDVNFTMNPGASFTNNGTAIFNGTTNITTAAGYAPNSLTAQTIVNGTMTINDGTTNFNWDGSGTATTIVNGASSLSITANMIDTGDNVFGGTITLNDNADLTVFVADTSWTILGTLNKNNAGTSSITGDRVVITGQVNANGGTLDMPATTTTGTSDINVASTMTLGGTSVFGGGAIDGAGTLLMEGTSSVTANTTIAVGTFDWDGLGTGTSHTISDGVVFTINSPTLDSDGDMDDPVNLGGNGAQLLVNGPTAWTQTATFNANNAAAGTATIGGTSHVTFRNILNVNGNTTITAPATFGPGTFFGDIDAGMTLNANNTVTYTDGVIDGAGRFDAGTTNTVTGDFTINADNFNIDAGNWVIESGAELTFNSADYDPDSVAKAFGTTITINNGSVAAFVADPTFVMDGILNMNASGGNAAQWVGDPIDIGNDTSALDADLNVTGDGNGNSQGRFIAPVNFKSDADVNVPAAALLSLAGTVNFNTVNAANNAEFTGAGTMMFFTTVNVNEAVTLNMVGGTVDLDGNDATGEFINIDAPMTINAATMSNFGRVNGGGGINTLDVNNSVGTGVLTVNLDDPAGAWTLNGPGVMNLVNDNTDATLLAGSDVKLNGTVNVTGDVRSTARLDIAGIVNINTAGQPLRLAGGSLGNPNILDGGTINGPGILGADTGSDLRGFGTINANVDFDGTADLYAVAGELTVNGAILDVAVIGTLNDSGILNVTGPWSTSVATTVVNQFGGEIRGGTITVANANGIRGQGLVSARVINNTRLVASNFFVSQPHATHVFQTAGNDNDWDGAANTGILEAEQNKTLELRDDTAFSFGGTVLVAPGGRVFANGFRLDCLAGSTINLTEGTFESTRGIDIGGTLTVAAGAPSTIKVENNYFMDFETGSNTTLNGNLHLENNNIIVDAGATFSGAGAMIVPDGSHIAPDNLAEIGVVFQLGGSLRPAQIGDVARVEFLEYQQTNTGKLYVDLTGTTLSDFDRLVVDGDAVIDGFLEIDIDDGFVPELGTTFPIISASNRFGQFDYYDIENINEMPDGLTFKLNYLDNGVELEVVLKEFFEADFDEDGDVDFTDFAIWKGAFNLNQLGDATGDNISNAADYTIWRDQLGSKSDGIPGSGSLSLADLGTAAVPEPGTLVLLVAGLAFVGFIRRDR
jgi:hypothetical protein